MLSKIQSRACFAAENILTKSIRAVVPSTAFSSPPLLHATRKWPVPEGQHGVVVVHDANPCALAQHLINGYKDFFNSEQGKPYNGTLTKFTGDKFLEEIVKKTGEDNETLVSSDEKSSSASASLISPGGCVVLIQNHAFQNETHTYRLRLPLMEMGLRVVEHPHLVYATTPVHVAPIMPSPCTDSSTTDFSPEENLEAAITPSPEDIFYNYVESCCVDPEECDREAKIIGKILDEASSCSIFCHNKSSSPIQLQFSGALEKCLYNTGKFYNEDAIECGMSNNNIINNQQKQQPSRPVGGSFPFGEVISESVLLSGLNGECSIFSFPNVRRTMSAALHPFIIKIEKGVVTDIASDAPQDFVDLCNMVREVEGEVVVRELGIGLNRALGKGKKMLGDVTSFERQWGVHLSLGKRHPLFVKNKERVLESAKKIYEEKSLTLEEIEKSLVLPYDLLKRKHGKFHLDVFLDVDKIVTKEGGLITF